MKKLDLEIPTAVKAAFPDKCRLLNISLNEYNSDFKFFQNLNPPGEYHKTYAKVLLKTAGVLRTILRDVIALCDAVVEKNTSTPEGKKESNNTEKFEYLNEASFKSIEENYTYLYSRLCSAKQETPDQYKQHKVDFLQLQHQIKSVFTKNKIKYQNRKLKTELDPVTVEENTNKFKKPKYKERCEKQETPKPPPPDNIGKREAPKETPPVDDIRDFISMVKNCCKRISSCCTIL